MEELFRNTVGPAIRIETRLAPELHPTLCDPNQLENALLNLIINARDAMPDGGSLVIETANSVVADQQGVPADGTDLPPGGYATLIITDTGAGMTPGTLARAFDPFFTTKPPGRGTGLGLSMVYGFVQQSGGKVFLRSKEGLGTTITLYLPWDRGACAPARGARDRCDLRSASIASERGRAGGRRRAGPAYGRRRLA